MSNYDQTRRANRQRPWISPSPLVCPLSRQLRRQFQNEGAAEDTLQLANIFDEHKLRGTMRSTIFTNLPSGCVPPEESEGVLEPGVDLV